MVNVNRPGTQTPQPTATVIRTPRPSALFPGWGVRF